MTMNDQQRREIAERFRDQRIFVQIAAYRDTDLPNTIRSALAEAANPARVRLGICHQYDDATRADLDEWRDDPRVTVDAVPATESRGAGWARARTQTLWDHEPYTLQIDAHTRFATAWDDRSVAMLESIDRDRPILTNYPLGFHIDPDGVEQRGTATTPYRLGLVPDREPGTFRQRSEPAPPSDRPGRHPFVAAGNLFTLGRFCRDVPYDPDIYFTGEEINLAVRAYTHGYDLYYPNECLLWHWYDHPSRLHWQDHDDHGRLDEISQHRLQLLLTGDDAELGHLGAGRQRTVAAYEHFSGVSLRPVAVDPPLPAREPGRRLRHRGHAPRHGSAIAPGLDEPTVPRLGDDGVGPPAAVTAVQVLGPFNSGTCLMFNYCHQLTAARTQYHLLEWKHSLPPAYTWDEDCPWDEEDGGPPDELLRATLVVIMVRSPYFWARSTARQGYHLRFEDGAVTFSERLRSPVFFGDRRYDSLVAVWNAYYRAYRTHREPTSAAFVRLEDLVEHPMEIVRGLGHHLDLVSSPRLEQEVAQIAATPAKAHVQGPCVDRDQARRLYRFDGIERLISPADLTLMGEQLDPDLMADFGYPIVRPSQAGDGGFATL